MKTAIVIAIDGPAASGKSTTAKLVAQNLGYIYVDTGAMYRAATLLFIENNVNVEEVSNENLIRLLEENQISLKLVDETQHVFIKERDVSEGIRTPEVTEKVSLVASKSEIRVYMVKLQKELGKKRGTVMDGRDIGTVVFPDAELKIFMKADVRERAKRRQIEFSSKGIQKDLDELVQDLEQRDHLDSTRDNSPLRQAEDAILLDTSHLTINQQVDWIVSKATEILQH